MLRLHHDGVSAREIGRTLGVARSTIQDNLKRAAASGLTWPLPPELTDDELEQRLFAHTAIKPGQRRRSEPDWAALARELKRPGVNLMVLWEEYRQAHPQGYGYSRFCDLFREFERRLSPVMRQHHVAGDKLFVDYSGKKIGILDSATGEVRDAEIFVAVLGASNYTYAEATWTQTSAGSLSGMKCSTSAFIRQPGVVHSPMSRSISPQTMPRFFGSPGMPRTSARRAAVRVMNSSARAVGRDRPAACVGKSLIRLFRNFSAPISLRSE
jgi:Homeodomain-like domain